MATERENDGARSRAARDHDTAPASLLHSSTARAADAQNRRERTRNSSPTGARTTLDHADPTTIPENELPRARTSASLDQGFSDASIPPFVASSILRGAERSTESPRSALECVGETRLLGSRKQKVQNRASRRINMLSAAEISAPNASPAVNLL